MPTLSELLSGERRLETTGKTDLQTRAETAAGGSIRKPDLRSLSSLPAFPRLEKLQTLNHVQAFLRRCGFRVNVVVERHVFVR